VPDDAAPDEADAGGRPDLTHDELLAAFPDVADPQATESWMSAPLEVVAPMLPAARVPGGSAGSSLGATPTTPRRVSRFDRPKEPHDWRWVVGHIGRTLIAIGLLMFAFVAYQLWGTGIQTAQAQHHLQDDFEQLIANATTLPPGVATTAVPTTTLAATTVPLTTVPGTDPATTAAPTTAAPTTAAPTTAAPTTDAPATTALPPVIERPAVGDVLAKLAIPKIGIDDMYVVEGVTKKALAKGPGHFPESPFPGQLGNAAIAGHRTTYGAPFGRLDELAPGDEIIVTTLAGTYLYVVTGSEVVRPTDYDKVVPTHDTTIATLTLSTCHPEYHATQRLIIRATLDPTLSSLATEASPPAPPSTEPVEPLPRDDPTVTAPVDGSTPDVATTVASDVPVSSVSGTGTTVDTSDPATTSTTAEAPSASQDVFGGGWFDDEGAFAQVAWWGLALTALSLGAYAVSRAARRNWVGLLVGIAPFVVALYFWFENVNRLLPPGL